jgi:hypothetical protein
MIDGVKAPPGFDRRLRDGGDLAAILPDKSG